MDVLLFSAINFQGHSPVAHVMMSGAQKMTSYCSSEEYVLSSEGDSVTQRMTLVSYSIQRTSSDGEACSSEGDGGAWRMMSELFRGVVLHIG